MIVPATNHLLNALREKNLAQEKLIIALRERIEILETIHRGTLNLPPPPIVPNTPRIR